MASKIPDVGNAQYLVTGELLWGISPFQRMTIDWAAKKGTCANGKTRVGTISNVVVTADKTGFSASFSVKAVHRGKYQNLNGTLLARITDPKGSIKFKLNGMPDWKDNTTFEAYMPAAPIDYRSLLGRNYEISIMFQALSKSVLLEIHGNLIAKDLDANIECGYPIIAGGVGASLGATLGSKTTFLPVRLKKKCTDWSGSTLKWYFAGQNFIIGRNVADIELCIDKTKEIAKTKTDGYELGFGADISIGSGGVVGHVGNRLWMRSAV